MRLPPPRRFGRLVPGRGPVVLLLSALAAAYGAAKAFDYAAWYWGRLAANRAFADNAPVERTSRLAATLFERALNLKLVSVEAGPGVLRILAPPCEDRLSPLRKDRDALENLRFQAGGDDPEAVLALMCDTLQGQEILDEIRQWNASFHVLAIRDDRGQGEPCQDGRPPHPAYIEAGCKPSRWEARRVTPGGLLLAEAPSRAAPPHGDFAMIAADGRRGAGDWLMVAPDAGPDLPESRLYRLSTRLAFADGPVTVDLIGRPTAISVNGESRPIDPAKAADPGRIGPLAVELELLCADSRATIDGECPRPPKPGRAHAFALTLRAERPVEIDLAIDAAPAANLPDELADRNPGRFRLRRTAHLHVECEGRAPACRPEWRTVVAVEPPRRRLYEIVARDGGPSLVDASGRITSEAIALGLGPVIGLGPQDFGSLTAALSVAGGGGSGRISLTIDRAMQAAVVKAVAAALPCPSVKAGRRGRQAGPASEWCRSPAQRTAVVLMDADASPGEILAMASWPPLEAGLNIWDVLALEAGAPSRSPIAGLAWRATSRHSLPGSTFKVVTALAAMDAALTRDGRIDGAFLRGLAAVDQAAERMGLKQLVGDEEACSTRNPLPLPRAQGAALPYDTLPVPNRDGSKFFCIRNASKQKFAEAHLAPGVSGCPAEGGRRAPQIGLCEALITSSNLWFAGVALMLDKAKVVRDEGGREVEIVEPRDDLDIAVAARRLFPDRPFDLLRGQGPRAPRLFAEPMIVDAARRLREGEPRRLRVALSGYGQSVTATPLAIANVFASLATERIVRPRLVRRDPSEPPDPDEGGPLLKRGTAGEQRAALDLLRAGLAGAVASPQGTAHAQFVSQKSRSELVNGRRLFAKTGTADIKDERARGPRLFSSWLAGWIEGDPGRGIRRRIAFACWKSHSVVTGAAACGPIVRQILERLDEVKPDS